MVSTPASESVPTRGIDHGIFVLSLAILVLQIGLTRLLSVVMWYHFAFVAISLAMLGLALAGVGLYLMPRVFAATTRLLPWYCRAAGVTTVLALAWVMFSASGQSSAGMTSGAIAVLYLVLLLPFTLAGFAVSATLTWYAPHIGRLYARDLAGAALGCIIAVPMLDHGGAPTAILGGAILLLLGGCLYAPKAQRWIDVALVLLAAACLGWHATTGAFEPKAMHGVPDEDPASGSTREFAAWNSHSRVVVTKNSDWGMTINIDGHATTGIYRVDQIATPEAVRAQMNWMPLRAGSMPFVALGDRASVLLIGPGGGLDLLNGIYYDADIVGVELNGLIHGLMQNGPIGRWAGDVYNAPNVRVVHDEARSWVRRTDRRFDLIQASMIDTWAATAAGAFALAENSLYTVEAFADFRTHLSERGLVHFLRWNESPPRQSLRILALAAEVMRRDGDHAPERHIVVLEEPSFPVGPPMASLLWSNRPFTSEALARLSTSVDERAKIGPVRILCWPGEERDNELSSFLHATDRDAFLRDYPFDVTPVTDDRPFFFHTARRTAAPAAGPGDENEDAVRVLDSVLWTVLAISVLAFVLPMLLTLRRIDGVRAATTILGLGYFCAIGVGFMLIEIPMLQRFGLYLGHPSWSLSAVLGSLLLGAGIGGMRSSLVPPERQAGALRRALLVILVALLLLTVLTPTLLSVTLRWPFAARMLVTIGILLPIGWALGAALPLGVRNLSASAAPLIPWAWGMNGVASVLASVLAVVIGMRGGFTLASACGIACYVLALALSPRLTARS